MNKQDFLDSYKRFGISEKDVCPSRIGLRGDQVEEIAVIAPLHKPEFYEKHGAKVTQLSFGYYPAYKIENENVKFTFIKTQIGAPNIDEIVVALAFSNCKKIIFTGSCGALSNKYKIGDILLPKYSISGDGATAYYTKDSFCKNVTFGKRFYPTESLNEQLKNSLVKSNQPFTEVGNISIDTIVGQFFHIDEFISLGADVVEMETASVFCLAEMLDIEAVAILNVSDSTIEKKSLLSGRSDKELEKHYYTEDTLVPRLVLDFIKRLSK